MEGWVGRVRIMLLPEGLEAFLPLLPFLCGAGEMWADDGCGAALCGGGQVLYRLVGLPFGNGCVDGPVWPGNSVDICLYRSQE